MQNQISDAIDSILNNIPGVISIFLTDYDGKLVYANGRFDILPNEFAAFNAVAHACLTEIENSLGLELAIIIAEYDTYKIFNMRIGTGGQLVITSKVKESQTGLLRIEANKVVQLIHQLVP
jgi:predicted regulator of Ras-like GTPase activity (Roadblock/LC7/MglB family)